MTAIRHLPIRRKLTLVIMGACTAALLAAGVVHFLFQIVNFKESFSQDMSAVAGILAKNSTAALAFQDEVAASEVLEALRSIPHVLTAELELPDGNALARFGQTDDFSAWRDTGYSPWGSFEGTTLISRHPVLLEGEQVGTLFMRSDYRPVWNNLLRLNLTIMVTVLAVSLMVAYLVSSRLQRIISSPIQHLAETARAVAERRDYSIRASMVARDEVGACTDAFNRMLERIQIQDSTLRHEIVERERAEKQLTATQRRLVEASRAAGMAEVATGVLHNVGNALNSLNVSASLLRNRLTGSRSANLGRVAAMIGEHRADLARFFAEDERGRHIPAYLAELARHLDDERAELLKEMESLEHNVAHIRDIVTTQQAFARRPGMSEAVPPSELVKEALALVAPSFRHHGITVERDFAETPMVLADKHKVLQILVNLLQNAKHALEAVEAEKRVIRVSLAPKGEASAAIRVQDRGVGIPAENLTRIFSHGFTTRKDGHGFGLHSGALAAKEMGGHLSATSDGPGRGATFTLELPTVPTP